MRSTVPQLLLYLVSCSYTIGIFAYLPPNAWNLASNLHQDHINQPVVKSSKRPLLTVIDPIAKTRIHLVGVAHGSESSAELVRHVISEIPNPAAVVLELCEERFFAISINAKIRPRGNETYSLIFDRTSEKLAAQRTTENAENSDSGLQLYFSNINNTLRFARSKGPIAGTLLLFLLFSSSMRQLMRSNTGTSFINKFRVHNTIEESLKKID